MSGIARVAAMIFVAFDSFWRYNENETSDLQNNSGSGLTTLVTGLILARGGSKGIPHKNMAPLNGHPLIHWALEAMLQSGVFHTIWVSTDDPQLKEYLMQRKGIYVHDRAEYTATDHATSISAVQEFIKSRTEIKTDVFCLVQATSPFVRAKYLTQGFDLMNSNNYDSVFSVTRQYKLRWSEIPENKRSLGYTKALNFNPFSRPRRQDWSGELIENGMFYFTKRDLLLRGTFQGDRSNYVEIPKHHSLEIDTPDDLEFANLLFPKFLDEEKAVKYFVENEKHRQEL